MKVFTKNIFSIVYIFSIPLLLIDSYNSSDTLVKYTSISSRQIAIFSIFLLMFIRILDNQKLKTFLSKINTFLVFPLSLGTCIALTIYDYNTPPNQAFALIPIQYVQLCLISIFSLIVILLQQPNGWFKKNYPHIIFASFFVVYAYACLSTFFPLDFFYNVSKEDTLIENFQFFMLLLSAFFSLKASSYFYKKHKIHFVIFALLTILLLLISGDEISWGQRLFHFTTPEFIATNNDQKEMTIHNLSSLAGYVGIGYIIIGFFGAFAWIFRFVFLRLKKAPYDYYIPAWYCMGYYFFGFLFNYYNRVTKYHPYSVWSEFAELMLYTGIMFTLLGLNVKMKNNLPV